MIGDTEIYVSGTETSPKPKRGTSMRITALKSILCISALVAATSLAEDSKKTDSDQTSTREAGKSQTFCSSKDIVGANVKDSAGQKIGDISEIYMNPKTGEAFAAIDVSGHRHALAPVQALNVTPSRGLLHNAEVTINKTKAELESSPTIANKEWQKLDDSSFTQSIYSYYNVQKPSGSSVAPTGRSIEQPRSPEQPAKQPRSTQQP